MFGKNQIKTKQYLITMSDSRYLLSKYFSILEENKDSNFFLAKNIPIQFNNHDSTNKLWDIHDTALSHIKLSDIKPSQSLLDLKIELASRIYNNCCFCERRCGVDRNIKSGNCKVKESKIASEFLHIGEENVLVPSHTIFFSGCTLHCVFCQNWDISQQNIGYYLPPKQLVDIIIKRNNQGSKNVNWVGGDPTPNLKYILQTLIKLDLNIPQIWNSNMYCSKETMNILNNVIDLYLTDFKYWDNKCAKRLSKVENYQEIVKRNHKIAYENGDMIIRHLVMPNHIECCSKPIIKWISKNLPDAVVNIMPQYKPEYKAHEYKDISKKIYHKDFLEVKRYAEKLEIYQI
jgi:putative pyruvate formate lyase activating enzyme